MSSQFSIQLSHTPSPVARKSATEVTPEKSAEAIASVDRQLNLPKTSRVGDVPHNQETNNEAAAESMDDLVEAVKKIQEEIQHSRQEIKFEVNKETGVPVVSVLDHATKKVIRQFPPEEILALAERVSEMDSSIGGSLFNSVV